MSLDGPHIGFIIHQMENGRRPEEEEVRKIYKDSFVLLLDLTGLEHRAFVSLEDPDKVYQVSGWNAVDEHYSLVHNTPEFLDLLDSFGDILYMTASYHTSISYKDLPRDTSYFTLLRCHVPQSRKSKFDVAAKQWLAFMLKTHATKGCHGWRTEEGGPDSYEADDMARYRPDLVDRFEDEAEDAEEWDVMLPWTDAEKWKAELDAKALSPILENLTSLEVRRLKLLDTKNV